MFTWIVQKINRFVEVQSDSAQPGTVIGVLDIYGFEVFQVNRYVVVVSAVYIACVFM